MNEDTLNNHRRSLREILPKGNARSYKRSIPTSSPVAPVESEENLTSRYIPEDIEPILQSRRMPKIPKYAIWIIGLAFVVLLIFVVGSFFTKATVYAVPKQARVNVDETFTAKTSPGVDELEFGTISNVITESVVVPASGTKEVSEKATGKITIYNNYGAEPQTLIAKTRFETSDGKIYRIAKAVTVPGQKTEAGKLVSGSAVVDVTADEAGAEYNIGASTFTIPGFKGTDRFDKFSAKSVVAMTGGMVGTVSNISESDREDAEAELKDKLAKKSSNPSSLSVPSGHTLLKDALVTSTDFEIKDSTTGTNQVTMVGKLTYTGVVISEKKLASFLAGRYVPDYNGEAVGIKNINDLKISLSGEKPLSADDLDEIEISIDGSAHLVWEIDEKNFKESLGGYNKGNFNLVLEDFPALESLEVKIMPPWARSIPEDPNKVEIVQVLGEETK